MKRTKQQLYAASLAGWDQEMPFDIWNVIIEHLPETTPYVTDLGLMLTLMGTCKTICGLFRERIKKLIYAIGDLYECHRYGDTPIHPDLNIRSRDGSKYTLNVETHAARIALFFCGLAEKISLDDILPYLHRCCLDDKAYHTPAYLSNSVSLLHLATLEGQYLHTFCENDEGTVFYDYMPFFEPRHDDRVHHAIYVRPPGRKAFLLNKVHNDVSACTEEDFIESIPPWWGHTKQLLVLRYLDKVRTLRKTIPHSCFQDLKAKPIILVQAVIDQAARLQTKVVDMLREGGAVIKTRRPRYTTEFRDLIVNVDGEQHYIYAEKAKAFRACCFYNRLDIESARIGYLLDRLHGRNWKEIIETDRFKHSMTSVETVT